MQNWKIDKANDRDRMLFIYVQVVIATRKRKEMTDRLIFRSNKRIKYFPDTRCSLNAS